MSDNQWGKLVSLIAPASRAPSPSPSAAGIPGSEGPQEEETTPAAAGSVSVYRFFDTVAGTHFYTSSTTERDAIMATRPDLVSEGVGLRAVDPSVTDPDAAPVYRFFDKVYGTQFLTASVNERDQVIASRPDLTYEAGNMFSEHLQPHAGDTPVYRYFDQGQRMRSTV